MIMFKTYFDEGPLDGLVNNAAGNFISPTKDLSHKGFDAIANIVFHVTYDSFGWQKMDKFRRFDYQYSYNLDMDWFTVCCSFSYGQNQDHQRHSHWLQK